MAALILVASAAAIIIFVRFGLMKGIDHLAAALNWTPKTRGQATGLATSSPEFVGLVAAGLAGVWDVGLWNIASSNVINVILMALAVTRYRQWRDLVAARFFDEIAFALAAIMVPIGLMQMELDTHWALVPVLLGFFVVYRVVDARMNPVADGETETAGEAVGNLPLGMITIVTALVLIAVAGFFLGDAAESVVNDLGVPVWAAGWILGFVTSLPEMVTFFAVYSTAQKEGKLGGLEDTQEALDNLTSSNMSNVGLIYPIGLAVFLVVTQVL